MPVSNDIQAEDTGGTPSLGLEFPQVRSMRARGRVRHVRGHNNATSATRTPIPEHFPTGGAKYPTFAKEVPHPQVASQDRSIDDRVIICPDTPSFTTVNVFGVTVITSPVELENRLEESPQVLKTTRRRFRLCRGQDA